MGKGQAEIIWRRYRQPASRGRDEVTVAEMIGIAGLEVAWRDRTEA